VVARDFAAAMPGVGVTSADLGLERAEEVVSRYGGSNLAAASLDAGNEAEMASFLKGFDLVISALPGGVGFAAAKACVAAGRNLVDVSFSPEDPFSLGAEAARKGLVVIPDCGVAPGLSNALVGRAVSQLETVDSVHVMVGGLPIKPLPPLGYTITWSVEGLIDEYTRKARIVEDGDIKEVEALSGVERVDFPGVGPLDAFFTDGARTLFRTVGPVREMWEKTLRYPGHVDSVKSMRELGLFNDAPIEVGGATVSPRQLTSRLMEERLRIPGSEDLLAMKVEVKGGRDEKELGFTYTLLDYFDRATGTSAMARTTAFTTSVVAQMVARGEVEGKGILTPEEIGMRPAAFGLLLQGLRSRGVVVT